MIRLDVRRGVLGFAHGGNGGTRPGRARRRDPPADAQEVGFDQNIGQFVPLDATFRDETGKPVRLADYFTDKPVVLSFAYDTCPMLCNLSVQGLASSLRGINLQAGKDFNVVTVSFDPKDTPERSSEKKGIPA